MIELPFEEKWVARYKEKGGKDCMGVTNHHTALGSLTAAILNSGGYDIVITDETCRPRIIDVSGEENEQHSGEVHTRAIGYSSVKEHK
jgi:hypothetical protein